MTITLVGFPTSAAAIAADNTSGYRVEAVSLGCPFGGARVGSGYAALARNGHASRSPLGAWDVRLTLPDRTVDSVAEAAALLGVAS